MKGRWCVLACLTGMSLSWTSAVATDHASGPAFIRGFVRVDMTQYAVFSDGRQVLWSSPEATLESEPLRQAPDYPPAELRVSKGGAVSLMLTIDVQGRVARVDVTSSSGSVDLDERAVAAARTWRYRPRYAAGLPKSSQVHASIAFLPSFAPPYDGAISSH
ncbi:energy transducer TonB [Dyella sp.]|uniref:energy transducer TonB n=1 Tax=Dyella sp. TaxID=1869338 RepID=UPI002ED50044